MGLFDKLKNVAKQALEEVVSVTSTPSSKETPATPAAQPAAQPVIEEKPPIEYTVMVDVELNEVADGEYEITSFVGFEEENMEIPAEINGQRIVGIGNEVFYQLGTIANIKIDEGIRYIGEKAFAECPDLVSIVLPDSLEKMGDRCFAETKIIDVKVPESVAVMGVGCFYKCEELANVKLPDSFTEIPADTFAGCKDLADFEFPKAISVIGDRALNGTDIILEELPQTLTVIGERALDGCFQDEDGGYDPIEELRLPSGLKTIGARGLAGLNCLKLIIPASVTFIGENAFEYLGCVEGEVDVVFEDGCSAVLSDGIFFNGSLDTDSTISTITIPAQITEIGDLFYGKETMPEVHWITDEYGRQVYGDRGEKLYEVINMENTYFNAPENLTIYCDPGSAAMKFAREKGINCAKKA